MSTIYFRSKPKPHAKTTLMMLIFPEPGSLYSNQSELGYDCFGFVSAYILSQTYTEQ